MPTLQPVRREIRPKFAVELAWPREDHPVFLLEFPAKRFAMEPADAARLAAALGELLSVAARHAGRDGRPRLGIRWRPGGGTWLPGLPARYAGRHAA